MKMKTQSIKQESSCCEHPRVPVCSTFPLTSGCIFPVFLSCCSSQEFAVCSSGQSKDIKKVPDILSQVRFLISVESFWHLSAHCFLSESHIFAVRQQQAANFNRKKALLYTLKANCAAPHGTKTQFTTKITYNKQT